MNIKDLEKSIGWKIGYELSLAIYQITKKFPKEELYCLTSQMRRSALSIPLNITEGLFRSTKKELSRFFIIARGSAGELHTQLLLAHDLGYITEVEANNLTSKTVEIIKILTSSIKTLRGYNNRHNPQGL
ncbi:MAG: four helix bundle protein [Patescibacteria group bacterium]|nr:four helix bundle protein [Patescibacteria group bacterium]